LLGRPRPERQAARYCCFSCLNLGEQSLQDSESAGKTSFKLGGFGIRIGVALLILGQSMIFGLAINLEPDTPAKVKSAIQGGILAGTLLVIAMLGGPLFRAAWSEIRQRRLTIEALFLLTLAGAMAASLQSFIAGEGPIYFEVVTVLLVVYSLGKAIAARSRAAALASTQIWESSLKTCRTLDEQGRYKTVEISCVSPGDLVEVRPGETIPVDGVIRQGIGFVSEAVVRGEPFPVVRRAGDLLFAGMASHDATFRIEATASGTCRQIDRLLQSVEAARSQPTSLQSRADQLSRWFFVLIVGVSAATFAVWSSIASWQAGLFNAMSVLLVACPCALGLATPIVIWSALNKLAERGIVAHTGDIVERLAGVDHIVFDKTGTLTDEQFQIVDIVATVADEKRAEILGIISVVEEHSKHPIAKPFAGLPRPFSSDDIPQVLSCRIVPGCGLEAQYCQLGENHRIRIGKPAWIDTCVIGANPHLEELLLASTGHRIDVELDGERVAIALAEERLRDVVPETLATCKLMMLDVEVLTGDTREHSASLHLPNVRADLLPEAKQRRIKELTQAGLKALVIGDGINDAPAMAAAHASLALATGTELANSTANGTLYHGDLRVVPWAVALSREATRCVRRNLWRAAAYNLIGITLAAFGVLHPVAAALLMVVSSLLVTWSSATVGMNTEVCCADEAKSGANAFFYWSRLAAMLHFVCFAMQGIVISFLFDLSLPESLLAVGGFLLIGIVIAAIWHRWSTMPHWLDMSIGMLTVGNLGMLLGWWADHDFSALRDVGCCECLAILQSGTIKLGMVLGMVLFASLAMMFLSRKSRDARGHCVISMVTGGNLGMIGGMILGAELASLAPTSSLIGRPELAFIGMSIGMIAGMLPGYEITRWIAEKIPDLRMRRRTFSRFDSRGES
jgi:heavy metal translocating P-type ATPase